MLVCTAYKGPAAASPETDLSAHAIVAIINPTPSTIFLTTFIMTLTKNNSANHTDCKEKFRPLKKWELLTESGRVDAVLGIVHYRLMQNVRNLRTGCKLVWNC
jgi:hypothetical protein